VRHEVYGPVLYADPKSAQRARRFRSQIAVPLAALAVVAAILVAFVLVVPELSFIALFTLLAVGIGSMVPVYAYLNWTATVDIHQDGLCCPIPTMGPNGRRTFYLPFDRMAWAFGRASTPLLGIKIGLTSGVVQVIPPMVIGDPEPILAALRARVRMVDADLEAEVTLRRLEGSPGAYAQLWSVRPANGRAQAVAALVAFLVLGTSAFLALPPRAFRMPQFFLVAFPVAMLVIAAGGLAAWVAERRTPAKFRVGTLWVWKVPDDRLSELLSRYFALDGGEAPEVERGGTLRRRRTYRIPGGRAELSVTGGYSTVYGSAYETLELRYPAADEGGFNRFLASFTRFAIENGLLDARDWRIGKALKKAARSR